MRPSQGPTNARCNGSWAVHDIRQPQRQTDIQLVALNTNTNQDARGVAHTHTHARARALCWAQRLSQTFWVAPVCLCASTCTGVPTLPAQRKAQAAHQQSSVFSHCAAIQPSHWPKGPPQQELCEIHAVASAHHHTLLLSALL
jgi:hypothetical protein